MLAEKPLISEETDLLEPTLLDELICNISTLASVYHKPPSSFVEGRTAARRFTLPPRAEPSPGMCLSQNKKIEIKSVSKDQKEEVCSALANPGTPL